MCVCVMCLRWHWVTLGLTLDDDVISGVDNVVLHRLFDYGGGLLHCRRGCRERRGHTGEVV